MLGINEFLCICFLLVLSTTAPTCRILKLLQLKPQSMALGLSNQEATSNANGNLSHHRGSIFSWVPLPGASFRRPMINIVGVTDSSNDSYHYLAVILQIDVLFVCNYISRKNKERYKRVRFKICDRFFKSVFLPEDVLNSNRRCSCITLQVSRCKYL